MNQCDQAKDPAEDSMTPKQKITKEELQSAIEEIDNQSLRLNDDWYVISMKWWKQLMLAIKSGYLEDVPKIDCAGISEIKDGHFFLKPHLVERLDYMLLPQIAFSLLLEAFGVEDEGRDIIQRKVQMNPLRNDLFIEVYAKFLTVALARDQKAKAVLPVSTEDNVKTLSVKAVQALGVDKIPQNRLRFYIYHQDTDRYELLTADMKHSYEHFFSFNQLVLVDVLDEKGVGFIQQALNRSNGSSLNGSSSLSSRWIPFLLLSLTRAFYNLLAPFSAKLPIPESFKRFTGFLNYVFGGFLNSNSSYSRLPTQIPGVCGLQNLGNTCFMASAIQCLSNVPPITEYFLHGKYTDELNEGNPLGTHGELAHAYAKLIKNMWSGENSSVVPRHLKTTIGTFAPRFSGYAQQDSQELMAFLLDGLHEDLNRIKQKPYNEEEDNTSNRPEDELAALQWEQYKARNDSIIVDKVHGQIKSTLICPICQKISIKFDPICFLSLPLPPREKIEQRNFILVGDPKKKWAQFSMKVKPQKTTVADATGVILNVLKRGEDCKMLMWTVDSFDNVKVLRCEDYVYPERIPSFPSSPPIYAAIVDPSCQSFVVVKNQPANGNRSLSVPLVFGLTDSDQVNQQWLENIALPYVRLQFFKENLSDTEKEALQFEVLAEKDGTYVAFTEETFGTKNLIIRWQTSQHFNGRNGKDSIERECSVPIPTDIHLRDCVDLFTKEEQLGEQDSWYCPRCKAHQRAMKKLDLWKLPEILIIHLKRFNYTRWSREKIDIQVEIPVRGFELTDKLANAKHEHVQYDLIAMSHHSGGLGGGHYSASALNPNGKWYEFNDSCVSERNPPADPLKASSPYMLVYRRRNHVKADEHIEMETDE